MDQQPRPQLAQDGDRLFRPVCGAGRDPDVERLAVPDGGVERPHRLLQWRLRVESVRVEDVDVVESHPLQALVQAGEQVLARAPDPVGSRPHVIAGFGRDHQLVAAPRQVALQDAAEILLGRAVGRAVVVRQVEVGNAEIEGAPDDGPLGLHRPVAAKVLPEPERHGRQHESAPAGPPEGHPDVALAVLHHVHLVLSPGALESGRPCHEGDRFGHRMRPWGDGRHSAAQAHHVEPVGDLEHLRHVVTDQDDRRSTGADGADQV